MSARATDITMVPRVALRDLGVWTGGGTPSKTRGEFWTGPIPWVSPKDMKVPYIRDTEDHISEVAVRLSATNVVPAGSVLMVTRSGILSRTFPVAVAHVAVALNQDLKALTPKPEIDPQYLLHGLQALERQILDTCSKDGTTVASIDTVKLKRVEIPVPSIEEQRAIVGAIEALQSRLESGLSTLKRLIIKAQRLESELLETEVAHCQAPRVPLRTLLRLPLANGRSVPTAKAGDATFPVLRLTALQGRRIVLSEHKQGAWSRDAALPFLVRAGDFLVARGNGSLSLVGRGGLVLEDADIAFPDTMIRVRPDVSRIDPAYLALVWNMHATRSYLERTARTTAGIYKINQGDLERLLLPVPDVSVQTAIVTRVLEVSRGVDRLKASATAAIKRGHVLRSSILERAFTGRLVDMSTRAQDERPWVSPIPSQEVPA